MNDITGKKCSKCGEEKPLDEFYKDKSRKYGVGSWCKTCSKKYNNEYNKEYHKEYSKEYYNKPVIKAHIKEHRKKPEVKERIAEYIKEYQKEYYKSDQGKLAAARAYHKRRALKLNQLHPDHNTDIETTLNAMKFRVSKCLNIPHHLDHIWPLAKGGPHHHANLQVIPQPLNNQKIDNMTYKHELLKDWTDLPIHLLQWIKDNHFEAFRNAVKEWVDSGNYTLNDFKQHLMSKAA